MFHRRKFLQASLLSSASILFSKKSFAEWPNEEPPVHGQPLVVSTWDFGRAANSETWKKLQSGGSVIDAVEAGVWVPEADPTNQTVGLGRDQYGVCLSFLCTTGGWLYLPNRYSRRY